MTSLTTARTRLEEEIIRTENRYRTTAKPDPVFAALIRAVQVRDAVPASSPNEINTAWLRLYLVNAGQMEAGPHPWLWRTAAGLGLVGLLTAGYAFYRKRRRKR